MRLPFTCLFLLAACLARAAVPVTGSAHATPRELTGIERLRTALAPVTAPNARVTAEIRPADFPAHTPEAFHIFRRDNIWVIAGSDASGVLYGCMELARRVRETGGLPDSLDFADRSEE